ncbi:MAG TPA: succinate dehydrogenase cytochrome b subunit [Candidatus Kapabacteria bacterium]|jgi:succinate dehydrogenase / fumarate reductase cytochrome b subunit|nr:succinate dehydrogenase cytochrome b subunit [Candidatus Kapabacteria bacterium]
MSTHAKFLDALSSQVGRKLLTGITGILLVAFVIAHLSGNLSLLQTNPDPFNRYTAFLSGFGGLLVFVEIMLALVILLHAYLGIAIALRRKKARAQGYEVYKSRGGESRQGLSSRTMAITGIVLLIFLVVHIWQFRFGPGVADGYVTTLDGKEARNLHLLVVETFRNIGWVIFYVVATALLGFHLRHGVWSMLQSLGAMKPRMSKAIYSVAFVLGLLLALGFLFLPIWIYLREASV